MSKTFYKSECTFWPLAMVGLKTQWGHPLLRVSSSLIFDSLARCTYLTDIWGHQKITWSDCGGYPAASKTHTYCLLLEPPPYMCIMTEHPSPLSHSRSILSRKGITCHPGEILRTSETLARNMHAIQKGSVAAPTGDTPPFQRWGGVESLSWQAFNCSPVYRGTGLFLNTLLRGPVAIWPFSQHLLASGNLKWMIWHLIKIWKKKVQWNEIFRWTSNFPLKSETQKVHGMYISFGMNMRAYFQVVGPKDQLWHFNIGKIQSRKPLRFQPLAFYSRPR